MNTFNLYLIMMLDTILTVIVILSIISVVITLLSVGGIIIAYVDESEEDMQKAKKVLFLASPILLISTLSLVLIPSTKQAATLLILPPIINYTTNNEKLGELPDKIIDLANEWVDQLSPKKESSGKN